VEIGKRTLALWAASKLSVNSQPPRGAPRWAPTATVCPPGGGGGLQEPWAGAAAPRAQGEPTECLEKDSTQALQRGTSRGPYIYTTDVA
jgi:hypothetical protein